MEYCGDLDFEDLLDDFILDELEWLANEFNYLFKLKRNNYTDGDIKLANQLLEKISNVSFISDNSRALELVSWTIKKIKSEYFELFNR